jgi:hypothetical protein
MATNTYVALDKKTISGSSTTSITFTSVPSTYTDLELVINARSVGSSDYAARISFNGDTSSGLYSWRLIRGDGSSASSLQYSNQNDIALTTNYSIMQTPSTIRVNLQNYANSNVNKTIIGRFNQVNTAGGTASAYVGLWRNTNAITSITVSIGGDYFADGSTFSLYGIKAQVTPGTAKATGGTITYDNFGRVIHTFTSSGTFTPSESLSCDYLVVAGGAGGASDFGGGGGAGGYLTSSGLAVTATAYTITVGAGGAGTATTIPNGVSGSSSVFSSITSSGGGGGGSFTVNGADGASGGGGAGSNNSTVRTGGAATPAGQGNAGGGGGINPSAGRVSGGGGGGAGAVGQTAPNIDNGGAGGAGLANTITGSSANYAGGGGGGIGVNSTGSGGAATFGGGAGTKGATNGTAGTANTGGGGGGTGSATGGNGGSGIVIIRYQG